MTQLATAPSLLPNLGAEEGPDWRRMRREPRVATAAWLWRSLFGAAVLLPEDEWPELRDEERGEPPRAPAFAWLGEMEGCVAWLGDEAARRDAESAGLRLHGPPPETVARVNDKAFALREAERAGFVPRVLRGTSTVLEPELLADEVATRARIHAERASWPTFAREAFTLKPRHGTSGRGRLDVTRDPDGALPAKALARLAGRGGAILEPWLERDADLSAQLFLSETEGVVLLGTLEQRVTPSGGLLGHRGEIDSRGRIFSGLPADEDLREAAAAVAGAALRAGYTGPCGVDAFVFRHPDEAGAARATLRPVVELNARFTMGIVSLGLVRREIHRVRSALRLRPGDRRAFELRIDAPQVGWEAACERAGSNAFVVPLHREDQNPRQPNALAPAILFAESRADLAHALEGAPKPTNAPEEPRE